jgi:signal transduction histidine kinase
MTFRTKLLLISSFTLAGAVALVTGAVSIATRRAFERTDTDRREALLGQFRSELDAQAREVVRRVDLAAMSPAVQQIVAGAADYDRAGAAAEALGLDFFDVVDAERTIISSAHWPARFGYKNDWPIAEADWTASDAFLARIPLPEGSEVALVAVHPVEENKGYIVGGRRLTPEFLRALGIAPGMRALLWFPPSDVIDAQGAVSNPERLDGLIAQVRAKAQRATGVVRWNAQPSSAEAFLALPLLRRGTLMGVLLAGTSLAAQVNLERTILWTGLAVGLSGMAIGVLLGWWTTERITRPVERLASVARTVAAGDLSTRVDVRSHDEIGDLARAFNQMTAQLLEQRDRAIQAERVAAWRELARRLAHELKNPLFPLQITVENLQRAREQSPSEFDEVFHESTATLLEELGTLKTIIGRFSDFAKMPAPQFERIDVNEVIRGVMKLHEARFRSNGRPAIDAVLELTEDELSVVADRDQLRRALGNLILNAVDAMPQGGSLRLHAQHLGENVRIQVSDTGQGLTAEECARLFTPYYTTKQHGTGLGLAIVQSVVSDHGGKISVESQPGAGSTFTIDLPLVQPELRGDCSA